MFGILIFSSLFIQSGNLIAHERTISLDFNQTKGPFITMFKGCVGAGRANEGLRADWQQQLAFVKKACDFKYIRMHGKSDSDTFSCFANV